MTEATMPRMTQPAEPSAATHVRRPGKPAEWLAVAGLCLLPAIVKLLFYRSYPGSDDSFIHLSVIEHITAGQGWGVNPNDPVNLSSSPMFTLLLLALHPFGSIGLVQIVSELLAAAGLGVLYLTARRITGNVPLSLATLAIGAANVQLWRWSGAVMEPALAFLMVAGIIYLQYRLRPEPRSALPLVGYGLLIGVATLTRFELGMFLPLAVLGLSLPHSTLARLVRRTALLTAGFLVPTVVWGVFSKSYFGGILPTTFRAKASGWTLVNTTVAGQAVLVLAATFGPLIVAILALAWARRQPAAAWSAGLQRHAVIVVWPVALLAFYYLRTPNLISASRYYLPALYPLPLWFAVLAAGRSRASDADRSWRMPALVAAASIVVALVVNAIAVTPTLRGYNENYRATMADGARFLQQHCDGTGPALVYVDIGIISDTGTGRCRIADAGALASPELRGLDLTAAMQKTKPQYVVETVGETRSGLTPQYPDLSLVYSRGYRSHGISTRGTEYYLNIYSVSRP